VRLQFVVYSSLLQTLHLFLISTLNQLSTRGIPGCRNSKQFDLKMLLVNKLIMTRENGWWWNRGHGYFNSVHIIYWWKFIFFIFLLKTAVTMIERRAIPKIGSFVDIVLSYDNQEFHVLTIDSALPVFSFLTVMVNNVVL
jgi:hypothetical protein